MTFIDNTAGEAALTFVNSMLAAFWGTAARRGWRPQFARVESKANVADAVSRGDLSLAQNEGWTRLHDNTDSITSVLVMGVRGRQGCGRLAGGPQLSRHSSGGRGRRAGVRSAPCPVPPSFGGRNVGSRARSALSLSKDVLLFSPRCSACLGVLERTTTDTGGVAYASPNSWVVKTSKRLSCELRHNSNRALGRLNDAQFENLPMLQAFKWSPVKILAFLLSNSKSRLAIHLQLREFMYERVEHWDIYISVSAFQGHTRYSDIASDESFGKRLTMADLMSLGKVFHCTKNHN